MIKHGKNMKNIIIIIGLVVSIGVVLYAKKSVDKPKNETVQSVETNRKIPRLLDLGADKCMACKAMVPVLEDLRKEYKDQLRVEFIDVWKNPKDAEKYKIQSIPTQIFFDADGKELFRHTGFMSKEDILKTFKEKGVLN